MSAYQSTLTTEEDVGQMLLDLARVLELPELRRLSNAGAGSAPTTLLPHRHWKRFQRKLETLSVPAREVVQLDYFFDRKTFNEPIYRCTDQAWIRRYDGARETYDLLCGKEALIDAQCSPHERAVFNMLLAELNGYSMAMQSLLLRPRTFDLLEPGELNIEPAVRTCCEDRRLAIKSLVTRLLHPLDEPLRDEAVRFMGAETDAERKMIVHRLEGAVRRFREEVFERSARGSFDQSALDGALVQLTEGRQPLEYRSSSWDLDRIYYYLLVQYFTAGVLRWDPAEARTRRRKAAPSRRADLMEHDWLCAARDVEMELERWRAQSKGGSLMPLTYALCALQELHPERARVTDSVTTVVQAALDLVEREIRSVTAPRAVSAISELIANLRKPRRRAEPRPATRDRTTTALGEATTGRRSIPSASRRQRTTRTVHRRVGRRP